MASDTLTPFLGLTKPVVNDEAGEDLWGEKWNRNADILDVYAQTAGGVSEAPLDGKAYARAMNAWVATLTDVQIADAISDGVGTVNWSNLPGKPATFPPSAHQHPISDVVNLQTTLDGKPDDCPATGLYYIRAGNAGQPGTQAWYNLATNGAVQWSNVLGKPSEFPPGPHTHPTSDITNLDTKQASQDAAINTKIGDAPNDGSQYARQSAGWSKVTGGAIISDTAPVGALPNSFWWESDTGALFINYQDVDTTQFVQVNAPGMPEAPKDAKPYARRDGAWFDISGFVDVGEMDAALGSYLPLAGGALTGTVSSTAVISASINGGAGTYALFGANAGAGGGVYGQGAGSIYGILGYAGGYSLYGNGSIYVTGTITTGGYIQAASGMQVNANYILGWGGGNTWTIPSGALFEFAYSGTTRFRLEPTIIRSLVDNSCALGTGSYRFTTVFATTGTINTSDENEKQDIRPLDEAELRVARALKPLICMYRWKDRVDEKGADARLHTGIIAQRVMEAFAAEGLDARNYGLFCVDPKVIYHPAVRDEDGNTIEEEWEEPDGVRYGVRYDEMAMFILAGL